MGCRDPDVMMAAMPSKLFAEWMAWHRLEPRGAFLELVTSAQIVQAMRNCWTTRQRGYTLQECMLDFEKKDPPTLKEEEAIIVSMFGAIPAEGK